MTRAAPLPLDERRAALISATEPLLERFGREVSTRQIAEAAGVAEGTIFRAFPTKDALIDAVVEEVFDVGLTCAALGRIEHALPLAERLRAAVVLLQQRQRKVFTLFHALRLSAPDSMRRLHERQSSDNHRLNSAIVALIETDRAALRIEPLAVAEALRTLTFSLTHPILSEQVLTEPRQIVDLLLYGVLARPEAAPHPAGGPRC